MRCVACNYDDDPSLVNYQDSNDLFKVYEVAAIERTSRGGNKRVALLLSVCPKCGAVMV